MGRFADIDIDAALVARAAAGDPPARQALYDAVAGPVFALVRRIVRERATAEDLFQDVLEQMYRRLTSWRNEAPFGFWVRQIAVRRCLMHLRSPWQRARHALDALLPESEPTAPETPLPELIDLSRALDRLSPTARAVLWLHDVEGLTHEQIGAACGQSASFSKSQLSRAHAALRRLMQGAKEQSCRVSTPPMAASPKGVSP
ncbi:MAG: sigma-70 family RNA polymerase sigma factor [Nevskiaceae bacterium]|jgi:RNA polymerase sigma-70 factor (ECF subfamily)|nr:sigma-70 family RNA polymerase sigma factor [Nevskiaceae bacterium]